MASSFLKAALLFVLFFAVFEAGFFFGMFSAPAEKTVDKPIVVFDSSLQKLPGQTLSASTNIVAVTSDGSGQVNSADVEILPNGKGRILFNTNPFAEPDTQQSLEIAAFVASSFTKKSLADKDVIYSISNTGAQLVGGPSAGAAFCVATIAAIEGKQVRADAAITGTIQRDGSIGSIGGIVEKMNALIEQKAKLFLIPKGQGVVTTYTEKIETRRQGNFVFELHRLVPKQVDLLELGKQQGLEVKEVAGIEEAVAALIE